MPKRAVRQRRSPTGQRMLLPIVIHEPPLLVLDRLAIGLLAPQKISRPLQQQGTDELLVAQGEREGSR